MPEGDQPFLRGRGQIAAQPVGHRAVSGAVRGHRVEANEVDVAVVKGVIVLGAGGDAARFAVFWKSENAEIRITVVEGGGLRGVMVPESRPEKSIFQRAGIHVENGCLVFGVGAVLVGVVAEHQEQVRSPRTSESVVGIPHAGSIRVSGARVAQNPNARRLERGRQSADGFSAPSITSTSTGPREDSSLSQSD